MTDFYKLSTHQAFISQTAATLSILARQVYKDEFKIIDELWMHNSLDRWKSLNAKDDAIQFLLTYLTEKGEDFALDIYNSRRWLGWLCVFFQRQFKSNSSKFKRQMDSRQEHLNEDHAPMEEEKAEVNDLLFLPSVPVMQNRILSILSSKDAKQKFSQKQIEYYLHGMVMELDVASSTRDISITKVAKDAGIPYSTAHWLIAPVREYARKKYQEKWGVDEILGGK